jgi:putative flippase GtrA
MTVTVFLHSQRILRVFKAMRPPLDRVLERRESRFILTGAGLAIFFFVVSFLLVSIGLVPFASSVLAYVSTLGIGYVIQRNWSFCGRHAHAKALPRYLSLQAGCAVMSGVDAQMATTFFHMPAVTMSILNTVIVSLISYVVSLNWVFPDDRSSK